MDFPTNASVGKVYLLDRYYTGIDPRMHVSRQGFDARGKCTFRKGDKLALMANYAMGENMAALTKLPVDSLLYLDLRRLEIKSADLSAVSHLRGLWQLALQNTDVDDSGLQHLKTLTSLKALDLSKTLITGSTLGELLKIPGLESLDVGRTQIQEKYLAVLPKLKNLKVLQVEECGITDSGMKSIGACTGLEILYLSENNRITVKGLAELIHLKRLHYLVLSGMKFSDEHIAIVSKLSIDKLQIRQNQLSGAQLHKLREKLPKATISVIEVGHVPIELFNPTHKMQ